MKYQFYIKLNVHENKWVMMGESHVIPWDVRDLISASSGWFIVNQSSLGQAVIMIPTLQRGISQLSRSASSYHGFEMIHGLGTIETVLVFYQSLLKDCLRYPNFELCGRIFI